MDPGDAALAKKIGEALVRTHDYTRAIEYYKTAAAGNPTKVWARQ